MRKSKKLLLLSLSIFSFSTVSYSESIPKLLDNLKMKSDLSYKTRKQSLGHWIIFTRHELEQMHADSLQDVLKTLPLFNYGVVPSGNYSFTLGGFSYDYHEQYALYINDKLVNSGSFSDFGLYSDYPLEDIDHIEIYIGPGSVILGNKPVIVIIKLYTVEPSRENVSKVVLSANTDGGYSFTLTSAKPINKNYSYSFMVNQTYEDFPKFNILGITHSRNGLKRYLFLNLNHKGNGYFSNWSLDISAIKSKQNVFMGNEFYNPVSGINKSESGYISLTNKLSNNLKLHMSFTFTHSNISQLSDYQVPLFVPSVLNQNILPYYYYLDTYNYEYSANILKTFKTKKNVFSVGLGYQTDYIGTNNTSYNGLDLNAYPPLQVNGNVPVFDTHRDHYTVYFQDSYNINNRNLVIGSLKFDQYHYLGKYRNGNYSARLGYVTYPTKNLMIKSFLYRTYTPPTMYYVMFRNSNLSDEIYKGASTEIDYKRGKNTFRVMYAYIDMKDIIEPNLDYQYGYYNETGNFYMNTFFVSDEYRFDYSNKILLNYFVNKINKNYTSPNQGFSIQLFNRYNKFDFYNELIYRKSFDGYFGINVPQTYLFDSVVTYHINNQYSITFRAENVLNSSYKVPVILFDSNGNPYGVYNVNAYPQEFTLSLTRLF